MWNGKRPLINRDILALPLAEGGLNIPRLPTKIQALRLNKIRRLLSHEQAHWKYLTSHFLRLSHMPTGKHTLALKFNVQHIDPSIPHFHKDLLTAWFHHTKYHTRTNPPATLADILHKPLFKNSLITVNDNPLYYREWIKAELLLVKDICYSVMPGFLPDMVIHTILTRHNENTTRSLQRTKHELHELQRALAVLFTNWTWACFEVLSSSLRTLLSFTTLIFDLCNRFEFINLLCLLIFYKIEWMYSWS